MQLDPGYVAEVRAWLQRAVTDLRAAELASNADPPLLDVAVFHCQQAAEKAVKGFLTWNRTRFAKTHDLERLGELSVEIDPALEPVLVRAAELTDYAWLYRYPPDVPGPSRDETEEAIAIARSTVEAILARLPSEAHP